MKVAWVVPRYGDEVVGGAESGVKAVAERLAARHGWAQEVLTTRALDATTWGPHYAPGTSELRGVVVRRFEATGREPGFDGLSRAVMADPAGVTHEVEQQWFTMQGPVSPGLLDAVAEADADVVVFKPYLFHPTVMGHRRARVPTVLYAAAHDEPAIRLPAIRDLFAAVDGIVFNTPAERRFVQGLYPVGATPQATIGLGVDAPPADRFDAGRPAPYLLCLGRVDDGKGTGLLAQAFATYKRRRGGPLQLVFAGPVVDPPAASPDTVVLGAVDEPTKWELLAGATALVSPSPHESLALVLLESWRVGTPVLVNAGCAPTREQVERSGGGLVFGSYAELEVAIDELVERPALVRHLGDHGRRYAEARYDWASVTDRYAAFLEGVVRRGRVGASAVHDALQGG